MMSAKLTLFRRSRPYESRVCFNWHSWLVSVDHWCLIARSVHIQCHSKAGSVGEVPNYSPDCYSYLIHLIV